MFVNMCLWVSYTKIPRLMTLSSLSSLGIWLGLLGKETLNILACLPRITWSFCSTSREYRNSKFHLITYNQV